MVPYYPNLAEDGVDRGELAIVLQSGGSLYQLWPLTADLIAGPITDGKYFGSPVVLVTPTTDYTLYVTNYPPEADSWREVTPRVVQHTIIILSKPPTKSQEEKRQKCGGGYNVGEEAGGKASVEADTNKMTQAAGKNQDDQHNSATDPAMLLGA
ncbi:hypothetical protein B0T24DRAFT_690354 [Lasiosphaeria ovina]|uniref:Uncharacterized protein n=1 Tax=Lasiosphaeria ovina TaxID=92902 RepID=A0AAE0MYQ1_9PEZI|nr:hypothetical protein B0T24DRAFT_690354 [Lasiosphaeria ovina]